MAGKWYYSHCGFSGVCQKYIFTFSGFVISCDGAEGENSRWDKQSGKFQSGLLCNDREPKCKNHKEITAKRKWHTILLLVLGRLKQKDHEFRVNWAT